MHAQSSLTLCDRIDGGLPGSSVHGISQVRILEWIDIASSRELFWPRNQIWSPASPVSAGRFFTTEPAGKPLICVLYLK